MMCLAMQRKDAVMGNSTYKVLTDSTLDTCKFNKKLFYLNFALILVHDIHVLKGHGQGNRKF